MKNRTNRAQLNLIKLVFYSTMLFMGSAVVNADVPFPGKRSVIVVSIEAANIINVNLETWPGFRRNVQIILPGLEIPGQEDHAAACELELAEKAYQFTVNFLSDASDISVKDMVMENSASTYAFSSIYTRSGTLDNALKRERLARPVDHVNSEPWC